jgi:hypothetical protein
LLQGLGIEEPVEPVAPTEEDLKAQFEAARALRSPTLDLLREKVPEMPTSGLLMMLLAGGPPFGEEELALPHEERIAIGNSALLTICDEIDRRVPLPTPPAPK